MVSRLDARPDEEVQGVPTPDIHRPRQNLLAPVRNGRRIAGKTPAPRANFVVSRHKHYVLGVADCFPIQDARFSRYKVATLPTPSASTGAMKACRSFSSVGLVGMDL